MIVNRILIILYNKIKLILSKIIKHSLFLIVILIILIINKLYNIDFKNYNINKNYLKKHRIIFKKTFIILEKWSNYINNKS